MGGFHAYYVKGDLRVGMVCECNSLNVFEISATGWEARQYVMLEADDSVDGIKVQATDVETTYDLMMTMCVKYEADGFVEADWMFNNSRFWDEFYSKLTEQNITYVKFVENFNKKG